MSDVLLVASEHVLFTSVSKYTFMHIEEQWNRRNTLFQESIFFVANLKTFVLIRPACLTSLTSDIIKDV